MYLPVILILLSLSVVTLLLAKKHPGFKPVGGTLLVAAVLLMILKPENSNVLPVSRQALNDEAKGVGEQLANAIIRTIPKTGVILVVHPNKNSSAYAQNRIQKHLQGLSDRLESTGYSLITHGLVETDSVNDPLTEGTFVGSLTLSEMVVNHTNSVGVVLLGLNLAVGEEAPDPSLPPLILAGIGDPVTSEWALDNGIAVAALFEKIDAPLSSIQEQGLSVEERFNRGFELRLSNP